MNVKNITSDVLHVAELALNVGPGDVVTLVGDVGERLVQQVTVWAEEKAPKKVVAPETPEGSEK